MKQTRSLQTSGITYPATLRYKSRRLELSITRLLKSQNLFNLILVHEVRANDYHIQRSSNTKINVRVCIKVPVIPHRKHSMVPLEGSICECCILEITVMCCVDHSELCGGKNTSIFVSNLLIHIANTMLSKLPLDDSMYHPDPSLITKFYYSSFTNRCTFIELWLKFTLKLDGSYMFRSTTIIRELAIEPAEHSTQIY